MKIAIQEPIKTDYTGEWLAHDLAEKLHYSNYEKFLPVIARAQEACTIIGENILDNFVSIIDLEKDEEGDLDITTDIKLSSLAMYLIVQNGDIEVTKQNEDKRRCFLRTQLKECNKHLNGIAQRIGNLVGSDFSAFRIVGIKVYMVGIMQTIFISPRG